LIHRQSIKFQGQKLSDKETTLRGDSHMAQKKEEIRSIFRVKTVSTRICWAKGSESGIRQTATDKLEKNISTTLTSR
jgi:hypothetical protein